MKKRSYLDQLAVVVSDFSFERECKHCKCVSPIAAVFCMYCGKRLRYRGRIPKPSFLSPGRTFRILVKGESISLFASRFNNVVLNSETLPVEDFIESSKKLCVYFNPDTKTSLNLTGVCYTDELMVYQG